MTVCVADPCLLSVPLSNILNTSDPFTSIEQANSTFCPDNMVVVNMYRPATGAMKTP